MVVALLGSAAWAPPVAAADSRSGDLWLAGRAAADFQLPVDVRGVGSWTDPRSGLTVDRFQQYALPLSVYVDGAQLVVVRRGKTPMLVVGAHYPGLRSSLRALLSANQATIHAATDTRLPAIPAALLPLTERRADLRLDPVTGRQFYLVESGAPGIHQLHRVDAMTGAVIDAWQAIEHADGMATGTRTDRKSLRGADETATADDLTSKTGSTWRMRSVDGRIVTYDAKKKGAYGAWANLQPLTDSAKSKWANDNDWAAPYQGPAVDAQYYAALTDAFFRDELGFDLLAECPYGAIRNVVHFDPWPGDGFGYDNAFWDGFEQYMVYGDGDGVSTRAFSAGQDVVTHELGHALTQCRVDLVYQDEPGALNEAFSDIMAAAAEWLYEEPLSSKCRLASGQSRCADWWLGEDVVIDGGWHAFRNLADPATEGQPSHYSARKWIGKDYDNGGVHVNSGIVNHAFYLTVNGGRNARCAGPSDGQADCDVFVPPIPLADAAQLYFFAFGLLTEQSNMCAARNATVAAAALLFPGSAAHGAAADLGWAAVGRSAATCQPQSGFSISMPNRSIALAPGSSGQLAIDLTRSGGHSAEVSFSISDVAPAGASTSTTGVVPNDDGLVAFNIPADAPSGIHPAIITATDGSLTRTAAAVLSIDADPPAATVDGVRFLAGATVSTSGSVPVQVAWTASDPTSGLAAAELQHSTDGTSWVAAGEPFNASAGAHHFRVDAQDAVGNATSSTPLLRELTAFAESAAIFKGGWSTYAGGTAWGTTRFSKGAGATATFKFHGTEVVWIAQRGPKRGKARVYLDGKLTNVDLYASSLSERRVVFTATSLAAGQHTLKIVVRGTSGRPRVDVDGFLVLAP